MRPSLESWQRFQNLSAPSRSLVVEAAAALGMTWLGLRIVGLRNWMRAVDSFLAWPVEAVRSADSALARARAVARFQDSAARHLFVPTNCLERSLALCWLLKRRGIAAQLRLGARKDDGRFEAHAWVEVCGTVLNDVAAFDLSFAPFA